MYLWDCSRGIYLNSFVHNLKLICNRLFLSIVVASLRFSKHHYAISTFHCNENVDREISCGSDSPYQSTVTTFHQIPAMSIKKIIIVCFYSENIKYLEKNDFFVDRVKL